jgi:uncharacterized membrane protein YdjX (TVP38/TMEM64 family)
MYKCLSFEYFKQNRDYLLNFVNKNYLISVSLYIFAYTLIVISTLPLALIFSIIGGFLFGIIFGAFYSIIGGTIGAIISFLIFRYILGHYIQEKYGHKLTKFKKNMEKYGVAYILISHVTTVIPFFLINMFAALTKISIKTFSLVTFIGVIPGSLIYAITGKELASINSVSEIFSLKIILIIIVLVLFSSSSFFVARWMGNKKSE